MKIRPSILKLLHAYKRAIRHVGITNCRKFDHSKFVEISHTTHIYFQDTVKQFQLHE
jgi:hypothetical protein